MSSTTLPATHRALVQEKRGAPPSVKEVPTPQPGPGSAVVRILFAGVLSYVGEIYDGTRPYPYPTPLTMGTSAVGRVAAVGPDAVTLKEGQLVIFDITIRGRDDPSKSFLSAIHEGFDDASRKLMQGEWRDGSYAEYLKAPLENLYALNEDVLVKKLGYKIETLVSITRLLVPYGGLGATGIDLRAGETVIVAPATGPFGAAAVQVALALGAGKVIAMGRNQAVLSQVAAAGGDRVVTAPLTGKLESDLAALSGHGPIDVFLDISPPAAQGSDHLKAAILALRPNGRVVLMGGILSDLNIPHGKVMHSNITIKGKFMYERSDVEAMIRLVESGQLRLFKDTQAGTAVGSQCIGKFKLEDWSAAFKAGKDRASEGFVVLTP